MLELERKSDFPAFQFRPYAVLVLICIFRSRWIRRGLKGGVTLVILHSRSGVNVVA